MIVGVLATMLAVESEAQFEQFSAEIGRTDLPLDARYETNSARKQNRAALTPVRSLRNIRRGWRANLRLRVRARCR